jgi:hypothetical protein
LLSAQSDARTSFCEQEETGRQAAKFLARGGVGNDSVTPYRFAKVFWLLFSKK